LVFGFAPTGRGRDFGGEGLDYRAVTADDFSRLPEVFNAPDKIIDGGKTEQGRNTLYYIKKIDESINNAVYEIRTVRKMLVLLIYCIRP